MNNKKAIRHLKKDPTMKKLIENYDEPKWDYSNGIFSDLVRSIVSQQLSGKAAETIWGRLKEVVGTPPDPVKIVRVRSTTLRECGLSFSKIEYIKGVARAAKNGDIDLKNIEKLSDEEVYKELTALKGVGDWTAEMIMMFTLKRPDIFSVGDLGIRTAVSSLYGVLREDHEKIIKISEAWRPHRTVACRYLWASLGE